MSPDASRANEAVPFRRTEVEEMLQDVTDAIGALICAGAQDNALDTLDGLKALYNTQMALQGGLAGKQHIPTGGSAATNG